MLYEHDSILKQILSGLERKWVGRHHYIFSNSWWSAENYALWRVNFTITQLIILCYVNGGGRENQDWNHTSLFFSHCLLTSACRGKTLICGGGGTIYESPCHSLPLVKLESFEGGNRNCLQLKKFSCLHVGELTTFMRLECISAQPFLGTRLGPCTLMFWANAVLYSDISVQLS